MTKSNLQTNKNSLLNGSKPPIAGKEMLDELASKINATLNRIRDGLRTTAQDAIEAGEDLIKAKAEQDHGCFGQWCRKHFNNVSSRQLQKYMRLAKYVREAKANSSSDLETILEGGIAAALHSFQIREEDLPPNLTRKTAKQFLGIPLDGNEEDEEGDEKGHEENGANGETHNPPAPQADQQSPSEPSAETNAKDTPRQESQHKRWVKNYLKHCAEAIRLAQHPDSLSRYEEEVPPGALEQTEQVIEAWQKNRAALMPPAPSGPK
jgi:hypothetical protein